MAFFVIDILLSPVVFMVFAYDRFLMGKILLKREEEEVEENLTSCYIKIQIHNYHMLVEFARENRMKWWM